MANHKEVSILKSIKMTAPGTPLRAGLENILRARTGALIVVSDAEDVLKLVDGGFSLNMEFSPAALYELAKMDGAIILSEDSSKIRYANAHLMPDPNISSSETGIRHRTAERVATHTNKLVIAISQRRSIISLYQGEKRYILKDIGFILTKANQAIQTMEKYKVALNQALANLSALEFEDNVTMFDITSVIQRTEMVLRLAKEIDNYIVELGAEGHLINLQVEELGSRVAEQGKYVIKDYAAYHDEEEVQDICHEVQQLSDEDILDHGIINQLLGYGGTMNNLDLSISPAGYRLLSQLPRIPSTVVENVISTFGSLQEIMKASIEDLDEVEGIGEVRARGIKDGLRRLQEQSLLDRHF